VINLGSIGVFLALYVLRVLATFTILKPLSLRFKRAELFYDLMHDQLIFGELISLTFEGYMELLISGILNQAAESYPTDGEVVGKHLSRFSLVLTLGIIPGVLIWLLFQKQERVRESDFEKRWGSLFHNVSTRDKWSICFYCVFIFRRMVYIGNSFILEAWPTQQIQALIMMNILASLYLVNERPLLGRL